MGKIVAHLTVEQFEKFKKLRDKHQEAIVGVKIMMQRLGEEFIKDKEAAWGYLYKEFPTLDKMHSLVIEEKRRFIFDESVSVNEKACGTCEFKVECEKIGLVAAVKAGAVPCPKTLLTTFLQDKARDGKDSEGKKGMFMVYNPTGRKDN